MNMQLVKELAESMGVSVADVLSLAQSVANSIEQDKVAPAFLFAGADVQAKVAEAYVPVAVKKFERFVMTMQINKAANTAFKSHVYQSLAA
jgi:hypothetical protein